MDSSNLLFGIVGAGISGLQAASVLKYKYGFNTIMFEQSSKIGGTWNPDFAYAGLSTHAPGSTIEFLDFPFPNDIQKNRYKTVTADAMCSYMKRYCTLKRLQGDILLNTRVLSVHQLSSENIVTVEVINTQTEQKKTYKLCALFVSGYGFKGKEPLQKKDIFEGHVFSAHSMNDARVKELKQRKETALVVGASKSAVDMIVALRKENIPVQWVARKSYSFWNRSYFEHNGGKAHFLRRMSTTISILLFSYFPWLAMKLFTFLGTFVNPHPEAAKLDFHLGVLGEEELKICSKIPFMRGEVTDWEKDGVQISNGKRIQCGTVICAFGSNPSLDLPKFYCDGQFVDVVNTEHLFQFCMHPSLNRVVFIGLLPIRGLGMNNALNGLRQMVRIIAHDPSREYMEKRHEEEFKMLQQYYAVNGFAKVEPQLRRFNYPNLPRYLRLVDHVCSREVFGCTKPYMMTLMSYVFALCYRLEPCHDSALFPDPSPEVVDQFKKNLMPNSDSEEKKDEGDDESCVEECASHDEHHRMVGSKKRM